MINDYKLSHSILCCINVTINWPYRMDLFVPLYCHSPLSSPNNKLLVINYCTSPCHDKFIHKDTKGYLHIRIVCGWWIKWSPTGHAWFASDIYKMLSYHMPFHPSFCHRKKRYDGWWCIRIRQEIVDVSGSMVLYRLS